MTENIIKTVRIDRIINECKGVKSFIFKNNSGNIPKPGQFVMVWVPGIDEIPMSVSNYHENGDWGITVKIVGECTQKLHDLNIGDYIGIRGPLGNCFPIPTNKNKIIYLIGGGIGMVPLKYFSVELKKNDFKFNIIQGAKIQDDLLFMDEFFEYTYQNSNFFYCTDDGSYGEKGFPTEIFENQIHNLKRDVLEKIIVYTCGPEIMMYKIYQICERFDIELYASLERIMRCGCGLCGLCALDPIGLLVCKDGPVFNSTQLKKITDFGKFKRDFTGKKISINNFSKKNF